MQKRPVSPIGPIVRSHCALCLASATDRRPSGMGLSVYTAAASNIPLADRPPQLARVLRNFVGRYVRPGAFYPQSTGRRLFLTSRQPPHLGNPTADDDVASRDGPSLRRSSLHPWTLTARVERRQVRHSEAARTCELEANLKRSRLGSQGKG
jgi:hypothetical protein